MSPKTKNNCFYTEAVHQNGSAGNDGKLVIQKPISTRRKEEVVQVVVVVQEEVVVVVLSSGGRGGAIHAPTGHWCTDAQILCLSREHDVFKPQNSCTGLGAQRQLVFSRNWTYPFMRYNRPESLFAVFCGLCCVNVWCPSY